MANQQFLDSIDELVKILVSEKRPCLIAIDGRPCAGKSTLADMLVKELDAKALFFDDFFIPQAEWPKDIKPAWPFPYMRDAEFVQGVKKLSQGLAFIYRPFDWPTHSLGHAKTINPDGIIIVEGVSVLRKELASCFHKKILVISNNDNEFEAISERENHTGLTNWKQLFLPSVELYWQNKPWQRADIIYAGRGVKDKDEINKLLNR